MQAHILSSHTPSTPVVGQRSEHFFSESSHVAYQIKGNGTWSTMLAHSLSLHKPLTLSVGSKVENMFY